MDPDGPSANLDAVDDHVVGVRLDGPWVRLEDVHLLRLGRREWVVHGVVALGVFVPFEEREVDDPQRLEDLGVAEAEFGAHVQAEFAELLAHLVEVAAEHENQVARVGAGVRRPGRLVLGAEELVDARLERAVFVDLAVDEAFGADLGPLDPVRQLVELLSRLGRAAGGHNAQDGFRRVEHAKALALRHGGEVHKLHVEAHVGLVAAVAAHRLVVVHAGEFLHVDVEDHLEQVAHHAFERVQDVFLFHEGHLAVDLGEFRLAIGAKVFVAEALHDLVVPVKPADHEELLERLGALRQGVELAGVHAAGHHKVAGAFRRGLDEVRRFDIDEAHAVEVLPRLNAHAVTQEEVVLDRLAAQVQIPVLHPQIVPTVGLVLDRERGRLRGVEHLQRGHIDFDVARRHAVVLGLALPNGAFHLDHKLATELASLCAELHVGVHVEG